MIAKIVQECVGSLLLWRTEPFSGTRAQSRPFLSPGPLGVTDNLDTKHTGILLGINLARSDNFRVGRTDRWAVEGAEERRRQSDLDGKEHFCFSGWNCIPIRCINIYLGRLGDLIGRMASHDSCITLKRRQPYFQFRTHVHIKGWAKNGSEVWWVLFLLLLTTSASTCLKNSWNLGNIF